MNVGTKLINFVHNVDKGSNQSKKMRSAGFEPAIPSLGSSYLNQAGPTSLRIKNLNPSINLYNFIFYSKIKIKQHHINYLSYIRPFLKAIFLAELISLIPRRFISVPCLIDVPYSLTISTITSSLKYFFKNSQFDKIKLNYHHRF